jgi:hypothetical protein
MHDYRYVAVAGGRGQFDCGGMRSGLAGGDMMGELPSSIIASVTFVGRGGGLVKTLGGFRKGHHTVPDLANVTTNAFLGRICEPDLAAEAERLFQAVRTALAYKRKDLTLTISSPTATLVARDFTVEIGYALEEPDPARYTTTMTLHGLREVRLAREPGVAGLFSGAFTQISFLLRKAARVEAIIDAIEALEGEGGLGVDYPSDYRDCVIRVDGVDAEVRCTGSSLELIFPRGGGPAELIDAFAAVRGAFAISKPLAGLID